ncbi:MAG: sulfite exporter TauE/SafE family protein [Oceanospirillales bacterium]|nr:MAG: sulfite exporter TauE/SafE family protein [Oceanospirillales bacterium]
MEWLLPEQLSTFATIMLILSAAATSAVTASIGIGGGILLLAIMAVVIPPAAIIPVHGMVQLGSNFNRVVLTLQHVDWRILLAFTPGALLGAWLASLFLVQLPTSTLQLTIAGFILFLCWGPKVPAMALGRVGTFFAAGFSTFISMFVGATGPLVAAFVKQQHEGDRFRTVANFAACMSLQHLTKAFVFGAAGFVFKEWLGLIVLMILSGAIGTWIGLHLLKRMSNQHFAVIFNWLLTLLAIQLVWQALT